MRRKRFPQVVLGSTGPKRAAIYCRVSTVQQRGKRDEDDKLSLEDQEVECRKLCQASGYVVNEKYVLREVSSGDTVHRPLLEEIYAAAKRGEIDVLVMYRVNRFARNDDKATYLYGRAVYEHQMQIEFVEAAPSEKLERFHMKFKSIFAEEYRDEVMRLTQEKRRERVTKRGLLMPGAWPLYGYAWDDPVKKGRYVIDEEAAAIVRRIFALAASGKTLTEIVRLFNAEGVPAPSAYQQARGWLADGRRVASSWVQANISRMLKTPAYWGEHAAFRTKHKQVVEQDPATGQWESFHEIRLRPADDTTVIPLPPEVCPPLVEKWQAEAAHQRIQANKHQASKHGISSKEAMLRGGYLLCGYCKRPMFVRTNPPYLPHYYCRSVREKQAGVMLGCPGPLYYVNHRKIDQAVWQDIVAYFSDPDWLERILARERERGAQEATQKKTRLKELAEARAAKEAAANQLVKLASRITSDSMLQKLELQMNELGAELDVLKQEHDALLVPLGSEEKFRAQQQAFHHWADDAIAGLKQASVEGKRQALYWLGVRVYVWHSPKEPDYELELTWRGLNAGRPLVLRERGDEMLLQPCQLMR